MPDRVIVQGPLTRRQSAVRTLGTLAFLALVFSVPVLHVVGLLTKGGPLLHSGAQRRPPEFQTATFLDGRYMRALETHLQEDSVVTWFLRGCYNELRWRLGILQNERVLLGPQDWMFLRGTLRFAEPTARARVQEKTQLVVQLKAEADAAHVQVLVVVVPDKERIYPEFAYPDGRMPPYRQSFYGQILGALRRAGFDVLDADGVLQEAKAAHPDQLLYLRRDTHWSWIGASLVGLAVARRLESGPAAAALGPRVAFAPQVGEALCVPDLLSMCGMLSYVNYVDGGELSVGFGAVAHALMEVKAFGDVRLLDPAAKLDELRPHAAVAMAGSSFAEENFAKATAMFLGRVVDDRYVHPGAQWVASFRSALAAIRSGDSQAKVLVWEFVERHWYEQ